MTGEALGASLTAEAERWRGVIRADDIRKSTTDCGDRAYASQEATARGAAARAFCPQSSEMRSRCAISPKTR
jgi:hypothetical protein